MAVTAAKQTVEETRPGPASTGSTVDASPGSDLADATATARSALVADQWTPPDFEAVMRRHSHAVYRRAYSLTRDREGAQDLTQDVFIRVLRALPRYRPGNLLAWLYQITFNVFLDDVRRRRRVPVTPLAEQVWERIPSAQPSPEVAIDDASFDEDVLTALQALPPNLLDAVLLRDLQGLSYAEIGLALEIKVGTVRSRIHRGRSLLRTSLAHRAPGRSALPSSGEPS